MRDFDNQRMSNTELYERLFAFQKTEICTSALQNFIREHERTLGLFFQFVALDTQIDEYREIAKTALDKDYKPIRDIREREAFKSTGIYSETHMKNLLTSTANNFLCYLSEILQEVLHRKPDVLRSREQLTTAEALQFDSVNDLIAFIADRKINELTYGGRS